MKSETEARKPSPEPQMPSEGIPEFYFDHVETVKTELPDWTTLMLPRLEAQHRQQRARHYKAGMIWKPKRRVVAEILPIHVRRWEMPYGR